MSCLVALIGFLFTMENAMYDIKITLNKKSKTIIISKTIEDITFQIRKQFKKNEKINIQNISKELDQEINREFLLS